MKRNYALLVTVVVLALLSTASGAVAQEPSPPQPPSAQVEANTLTALGTAFTYQGQIKKDGAPVSGTCDMQFGLWDVPSGGTTALKWTSPIPTSVTNGLFTAQVDFGAQQFNGDARWLEIRVRCLSDYSYTILTPRQPLTPAPYALALPGLYTQQNATSPNLIGGYNGNAVLAGVYGATIGGGGESGYANRVTNNYGTIGGGYSNLAGDGVGTPNDYWSATVGGGDNNTASGWCSTVGGGEFNRASGYCATVGGGGGNVASGEDATVGGGNDNVASGDFVAAVGGGYRNLASGYAATIPGGDGNSATMTTTFAAGYRAQAIHRGAFVWGDSSSSAQVTSTGPDQFVIRATGGLRLPGAGLGTTTSMFMQRVAPGNICTTEAYASVIDNPLTNGDPGAILVVTPNYGSNTTPYVVNGPTKDIPAVFYDSNNACGRGAARWVIYNLNSTAMTVWSVYNVFVIKP